MSWDVPLPGTSCFPCSTDSPSRAGLALPFSVLCRANVMFWYCNALYVVCAGQQQGVARRAPVRGRDVRPRRADVRGGPHHGDERERDQGDEQGHAVVGARQGARRLPRLQPPHRGRTTRAHVHQGRVRAGRYVPFTLPPPFVQWGKNRLCVLDRRYAGDMHTRRYKFTKSRKLPRRRFE